MSGRQSIFMSAVKQTLATSNGYQIATSVCKHQKWISISDKKVEVGIKQ